ncbi:MAG: adenine-specific DNA methylase [Patescibacteria group bacterium]|jgi:hypothetical protein
MKIERIWAMPSAWTFTIKPIKELLKEEMSSGYIWVDPFAGMNSPAHLTNDIRPEMKAKYHLDALDFLKAIKTESVDGVLFDPPYSPRQVSEHYKSVGRKATAMDTSARFYSVLKDEIKRILKPGGKAICFGWNTMGIGKTRGFEMTRVLIVPHGGAKNDTLCTVEIKQ